MNTFEYHFSALLKAHSYRKKLVKCYYEDTKSKLKRELKARYVEHLTNGIIEAAIERSLFFRINAIKDFEKFLGESIEEQKLLYLIKKGDKNTFGKLYEKYKGLIFGYLRQKFSIKKLPEDDLETVYNNICLYVSQMLDNKHFELTVSLEAYLKKIAYHNALAVLERKYDPIKFNHSEPVEASLTTDEDMSAISELSDIATSVFYQIKNEICQDFLDIYHRLGLIGSKIPIVTPDLITKDELEVLTQESDGSLIFGRYPTLSKKMSQSEVAIFLEINPNKADIKYQRCLTEWRRRFAAALNEAEITITDAVLQAKIENFKQVHYYQLSKRQRYDN